VKCLGVDAGPMSANPFRRFPFHWLRVPGMQAVARYYRYGDAREASDHAEVR
jgi:hypothetical protein